MRVSAERVLRNVCLASVLEPIPEKDGCTSRSRDLRPTARLEHFLIAGINIGWDLFALAKRVEDSGYEQPPVIFDVAYNAQQNSFRNRTGNRINSGIIELLVPLVTAQLIYACPGDEAITQAIHVLKRTTLDDVAWHYRFRQLAKQHGSVPDPVLSLPVSNVFDYFAEAPKVRDNDIVFHREIVAGLPLLREAYGILSQTGGQGGWLELSVVAYAKILPDCGRIAGIAADYVCVALYLAMCDCPDALIT